MVVLAMPVSTTVVCKQPLDAKKPNMLPRQGGSPCLLHVQELACLGSAGLVSPIEQAGSTTRLAHTDKSTIPAIGNDHSWTMRNTEMVRYITVTYAGAVSITSLSSSKAQTRPP